MSLEYAIKKPDDLSKINVNDLGELLWWSYILGVSIEKVLTTVEKIGASTELVKKFLHEN